MSLKDRVGLGGKQEAGPKAEAILSRAGLEARYENDKIGAAEEHDIETYRKDLYTGK